MPVDSDGNECDLPTMCRREPGWAASRIAGMTAEIDAQHTAKLAWKQLYEEQKRARESASETLYRISVALQQNGCDCECDCLHFTYHDEDCDRCLACRINGVIREGRHV